MTDFSGIQPAISSTSTDRTTGPSEAKANISSDFETFLKMLTVQMQNQDPLNPVEASEFAVQLATFSSVEQQVLTNDLLGALVTRSGAGLDSLADWVGMEVRVPGRTSFRGASIPVWAEPAPGSDRAYLVARDSRGNEITRSAISGDGGRIDWTGGLPTGGSVLHGPYAFEVESQAADGTVIDRQAAEIYTKVVEVQATSRGPQLVTVGGDLFPASAVTALRQP